MSSSALPATSTDPSAATSSSNNTTTTTMSSVGPAALMPSSASPAASRDLVPADLTVPTLAVVFALAARGDFRAAGAMYAGLLGTDVDDGVERDEDMTFPPPDMDDDQYLQFEAGLASVLAPAPWQAYGPPGLRGILGKCMFSTLVARARGRDPGLTTATTAGTEYKGKKVVAKRWVCWVRGCKYSCTVKGDVGRVKGHWEHHKAAGLGDKDPSPEKRWSVAPWRFIDDQVDNKGKAAKQASNEEEFLAFLEYAQYGFGG